jgi:hypothetical protein
MSGQQWRPHDALRRLRERLEAGYCLPGEEAQLRADVTELVEFARTAADLLAQVHGWCAEADAGEFEDADALREIAALVEPWE